MKLPLSWLQEYVDLEISPEELAKKLTFAGFEVEAIEKVGNIPSSVITVLIQKIEKHPQADRLSLCEVSLGEQTRSIVCGAKNMKEGDVVPLAQVGTILPDGKKIERSKIRGILSEGMLCSPTELGLEETSSGLMILPLQTPIGKPLVEALSLSDTILHLNITPNRADALSVLGIAREVAALTGKKLKNPFSNSHHIQNFSLKDFLKVEVLDREACPRYTARMIRGVKIAPSPEKIIHRLKQMGIRSINNVVDATNYVMMEMGQPLHAFDARQISDGILQVKRGVSMGDFETLDGHKRSITIDDILICDAKGPVALGGIMGGVKSGVANDTTTLVLESACFHPPMIRRTSKRLGLSSDSSYRFERGVDPNLPQKALERLTGLIVEWAGGEVSSEVLDSAPEGFKKKKVQLRAERLDRVLGCSLNRQEIKNALTALEFHPQEIASQVWECEVPTYRMDIDREIDLIEEVARIVGYDRISPSLPLASARVSKDFENHPKEENLRAYLKDSGFDEVIHYSFCSEKEVHQAGISLDHPIRLAHPLSEELAVMRPSLIPSLLSCIQKNLSHHNHRLRLYELRNIFQSIENSFHPKEIRHLALAMVGPRYPKHWAYPKAESDFYDLKGTIEGIFSLYSRASFQLKPSTQPYLHPGMSAEIWIDEKLIGNFGVLHPQVAENFGIELSTVLGEISLATLASLNQRTISYRALPVYPAVERDLTLVVPKDLAGVFVLSELENLKVEYLRQANLIDVYEGKPIEEGKKALTFSLCYQASDRTLTDEEVNQVHEKMVEELKVILKVC